jgi:hypothetical protein
VLNQPRVKRLLSNEHFSVDGTLVAAWASAKSFNRRTAAVTMMSARAATPSGTSEQTLLDRYVQVTIDVPALVLP